jgi:formylmethanofuran dehydrogenase subunit E
MTIPHSLLQHAARFHGHLGPHLVLGIRMGLLAKSRLEGDPFNLAAEIHTQNRPPHSCIVDGMQFSSGCTLGKGNIAVEEDDERYGIFSKGSTQITIRIKKEVLDAIPAVPREELEPYAKALSTMKDEELVDVVL